MLGGPGGDSIHGRLKKTKERGGGTTGGINSKVVNIKGRADTRGENRNNTINGKEEEGSAQDTTLGHPFMLRKRRGTRRGNPNTEGTVSKEILEENPHVTRDAGRGHLMKDMILPSGIIGFLKIKEDSQHRVSSSKGRGNTGVEASKRVCGTTGVAEAKLGGGKEAPRLKKPHQPRINHPLKELTDTTCQGNRSIMLGLGTRLTRLKEGKNKGLAPLRREITRRPDTIEEGKQE